jgi:hypothetical protein
MRKNSKKQTVASRINGAKSPGPTSLNALMPLGLITWLRATSAIFRSSGKIPRSLAPGNFLTSLLPTSSVEGVPKQRGCSLTLAFQTKKGQTSTGSHDSAAVSADPLGFRLRYLNDPRGVELREKLAERS